MKKYLSFPVILVLLAMLLLAQLAAAAEDSVCIQCHGGMEGRLGEPVKLWQTSVHAKNGISCNDCHGGDPTDFAMAMSPERGFLGKPGYAEVPAFCGRCHLGVKEDYLASAHGLALDRGGAQCVMCHSNHAIQPASIELINEKSCTRCHEYDRAKLVKEAISGTEATLVKLENSVSSLHRLGIDVEPLRQDLFAKRNDFRRVFHTVNLEKIKAQTAGVTASLGETRKKLDAYENDMRQRKLIGGVVVFLLLLGGFIALLIRRSYHQEE